MVAHLQLRLRMHHLLHHLYLMCLRRLLLLLLWLYAMVLQLPLFASATYEPVPSRSYY
jgi:hypothetical protein